VRANPLHLHQFLGSGENDGFDAAEVVQELLRPMHTYAGQSGQQTHPLSFEGPWPAACRDKQGIAFSRSLACGVTQQPRGLGWIGASQHGKLERETQGDESPLPGFA
jgi:hypothetical protein